VLSLLGELGLLWVGPEDPVPVGVVEVAPLLGVLDGDVAELEELCEVAES